MPYALLRKLFLIVSALCIVPLSAQGSEKQPAPEVTKRLQAVCSQTNTYDCYTNHKYGYVVAWPKNILKAMGESDAGDGQVFAAPDGTSKLVSWAVFNNVQQQSLAAAYAQALQEPGQQITYKFLGKNFFVVSGSKDGNIFYRKTLLAHGIQASFELSYAASLKSQFDPLTSDLARAFSIDPAFSWQTK